MTAVNLRGTRELVREIAVMQRAGIIELTRPLAIARKARATRLLGPIAGGIRSGAQRWPTRTALIDAERTFTYRELDQRTDALARSWIRAGISGESTVGVLCRDHHGLVESMAASAKIGARLVLLNTGFSATQLRDVATREGVDGIVADAEFEDLVSAMPTIRRLSLTPAEDIQTAPLPLPASQGGFVLLTGGTTGTPKGAPRRVQSPLAAAQFLDRVPLRQGQTILLCAPLFHGTALSQFILGLNLGATIVLHGRFDAARALAEIDEYRCDAVVLVPTMLHRILALEPDVFAAHITSSLSIVFSAGAALPRALGDRAIEVFGPVLYNFYGCTETGTAAIATPADWQAAPGTVGKPPVGIEVALFDEHGQRVDTPGDIGTIHVRNALSFGGYSGGGSKAMVDGMMSTGDLGHFDSARRLFIDGRDDDMIVSGGENVFPGEVEDLLYRHAKIAEAAVIGVEDEEFGQRLAAYVQPNGDIDESEIRDYVRANLARFKVPRDVVFVSEIPRTTTGKLDRRRLVAN